jgi:hypothetical protein
MIFRSLRKLLLALAVAAPVSAPAPAMADTALPSLSMSDPATWAYFSDQVMGGISEGRASFALDNGQPVLRLTGTVSTANRGGFIQARATLDAPLPATAQGVILQVRGNNQPYFVHLRTGRTLLPWQFYQTSFDATPEWTEIRLPFDSFKPYGGLLRQTFNPQSVRSVAIAAFGRDHTADLSVRAVGFY